MKNKYMISGIILAVIGLVFVAFAMKNPQFSFPWPNWVSYTLYGFYAIYTLLIFFMPWMKRASFISCIILGFEFIALGLIIISIGVRNTPYDSNWYLLIGLFISAFSQFVNLYLLKRRKKKD